MRILHPENKSFLYDDADRQSILHYALLLKGRTLGEMAFLPDNREQASSNKGKFGQILEKYYFFKKLNSDSRPDFYEAGVELKSSPLQKSKKSGIRAKERLVLNIINYEDIVNQDFEASSFLYKNAHILLVFYIYSCGQSVLEYPIKLVGLWSFPNDDLDIIRQDWLKIQQKVKSGKAHELSEGDTFYLGACTKGANAKSVRTQPFSATPAKQRAFSLKQGYVNHIIAKLSGVSDGSFGKIICKSDKETLEDAVINRFSRYYGLSEKEIANRFNLSGQRKSKQFYAILTKAILGVAPDKEIEEFSKADIVVKTIRIQEKNNLPKEDISFPAFEYNEINNEQIWEESCLYQLLEKKFLFVFFKYSGDTLCLEKAAFWTMPHKDQEQAHRIWRDLKDLLRNGKVVKKVNESGRRSTFFNEIKNDVMQIRPHARDAADVYPLPVADKLTGQLVYTKHCFWLNADYVRKEIYLKNS